MKKILLKISLMFFLLMLFSCEKNYPPKEIIEGKYVLTYRFPGEFIDNPKNTSFELLADGEIRFFNVNLDVIKGSDFYHEKNFDLMGYTGKWEYNQKNGKINISIDNTKKIKDKGFIPHYSWRSFCEGGKNITIIVLDGNESTYSLFEKLETNNKIKNPSRKAPE